MKLTEVIQKDDQRHLQVYVKSAITSGTTQ